MSRARIAPHNTYPLQLVTSKNRATQKYLETLSEYSILVQFEARSTKRTAICQTRSNAVMLYDTLPAEFIEKAICMKTKDQLYQRESVILRPRVVLRANSQSGSQDLLVQEARSPWESQQDAQSYGETRSNTADYRTLGISISTVKLQDARRQNNVTKLSEMFEKHQHKEQFLKDMSQKQEINRLSEESQKLLVDMNRTEIFEPSAKLQSPDCNAFTEIEIIYCSCWRILKYKRSRTTTRKAHCDFTSIPGMEMLMKARQPKLGSHPTILERWYAQERYRDSLAKHNVGEKEIMFFDRIALERHYYTATRAERLQNAQNWVLRLNADGPQKPLRQRPLKQCLKMQDAHLA